MKPLKTFPTRHCEGDSPKQSIEIKYFRLLPASFLAICNDVKTQFLEVF